MDYYYIGVDLGGTNLKAGIYSKEFHLIDEIILATEEKDGSEAVLLKIVNTCNKLINIVGVTKKQVLSID